MRGERNSKNPNRKSESLGARSDRREQVPSEPWDATRSTACDRVCVFVGLRNPGECRTSSGEHPQFADSPAVSSTLRCSEAPFILPLSSAISASVSGMAFASQSSPLLTVTPEVASVVRIAHERRRRRPCGLSQCTTIASGCALVQPPSRWPLRLVRNRYHRRPTTFTPRQHSGLISVKTAVLEWPLVRNHQKIRYDTSIIPGMIRLVGM